MDLSRFTIMGEQERIKTLTLQNARLIRLRWLYISLLPTVAAVASLAAEEPKEALRYGVIGGIGLMINGAFLALNRLMKHSVQTSQILILLQLALDVSIATLVTYQQGGLHARTAILFAVPIVASGLVFTNKIVYITALMSGFGYVCSVLLSNYMLDEPLDTADVLVPVVFYPVFFVILARLAIYMTRINTEDTREQAYDAFLALLSHQLKHPVSTVNAIIDQLEHMQPSSPKEYKKYVTMLKSENQNLLLLLNNLLETATPAAFVDEHDRVDLPRLLQEIAYRCAEGHRRSEDLKLKLEDMSLRVVANSEKLTVSLVNILNNAFQYSKPGQPVDVEMKATTNNVIITIQDRGNGMKQPNRRRQIQKYTDRQGDDRSVEGLGLGLFVANKVIAAHHGSLHIVSDKSGTRVIITLKRGH